MGMQLRALLSYLEDHRAHRRPCRSAFVSTRLSAVLGERIKLTLIDPKINFREAIIRGRRASGGDFGDIDAEQ